MIVPPSALRPSTAPLAARLRDHLSAHPQAHLRDAAETLGVPELAVLQVHESANSVQLRSDDWPTLLTDFATLGEVRTMTRNVSAVIERTGTYLGVQSFGSMGQAVGPEIDVRAFFREWHSAWAVSTATSHGLRRSIQLFDAAGDSIHKVFVTDSGVAAFGRVIARFHAVAAPTVTFAPRPLNVERPDASVDIAEFHARWDAMKDTHEFHGLLRALHLTRTQALRLAGTSRARQVTAQALERTLDMAAGAGERLMIFVGNRGIVQIHIGTIHRVMRASGWLNILDPRFNLHVRDTDIASAWVVTKQSSDGPIQSLELFDASGATILQIFGKRAEGAGSTPPGFKAMLQTLIAECAA